ncbi:MAG: M20/M25/M40 family metallo-hydrolase, partial [Promethearchaeota archaeon]
MDDIEKIVLDKIEDMREDIIKFHQEIVQIPSENPPSKYKEISKFIEMEMTKFGINTKSKRNNVIGELGIEDGQRLIFNAHFDTVEVFKGWKRDPFSGMVENNRIYGRGASDDKSCVTAEIFAAKALLDAGIELKGKLIITAVVDEELGGYGGTNFLLDRGIIHGDA